MKIAFIVNTFPPRLGGLEQHLGNLTLGLSELGVEVTVFTIGDQAGVRTDGKVRVLTGKRHFPIADIISFPRVGTCRRLAQVLKEGRFDAVSIHTRFFPMSFVGLRAAKKAGVPVIHTEHGSGFVASSSPLISLGSRLVDETVGRYVLHSADRVLGVSDEAVEFTKSLCAHDPRTFFNAIPEVVNTGDIADRPNHLVFVGRMVPGKGWDVFIRAIAELRSRGLEVQGTLLGGGEDLEKARILARNLSLDSVVNLPGRVTPQEVAKQLAGSTLVNPSILSEGFQSTLLEAIAQKGRVVTFLVPGAKMLKAQGAPVVITSERTLGSLVDALITYLHDLPPVVDMGFMKEWTWPYRSREYLGVLSQIVSQSSDSAESV